MRLPTTFKEDDMQGKRTRVLDSRGRPVPGLYVRDGIYIAGFKLEGRWVMRNLSAETLTEARRERDSLLAGLREGRVAAPDKITFADVCSQYQDARTLSDRTKRHERHLRDRHLAELTSRRIQKITSSDVAKVLRGMRDTYSPWTCVGVYRILAGTFALAVRRGIVTRNPIDGLAPSERPKQRNARKIAVLDDETISKLVAAGSSERWRAALALAGYAGLRLGEIRALRWGDVDRSARTISVSRSLLPDGTAKPPKTEAGRRVVPLYPDLRRALAEWELRSPRARSSDLIISTASGGPVQERNLRRAFGEAKTKAELDDTADRLSWHSLRHSYASTLATDLDLQATTLARLTGHTDAGLPCAFTRETHETTRRSSRTCLLARPKVGSVVSQPFSQPCASAAVVSGHYRRGEHRTVEPSGAFCHPLSPRAVSLPCRRSWVRAPSSASQSPLETAGFLLAQKATDHLSATSPAPGQGRREV